MVTIRPRFLNALATICVAGTSMTSASSATVRNSLTRTVCASSAARRWRSASMVTRLGALLATVPALLAAGLQLRHDAGDVLLHRVLIDPALLLLLLVLLACRGTRRTPPAAVRCCRPSGVKPSAWMRTWPPGAALAAGGGWPRGAASCPAPRRRGAASAAAPASAAAGAGRLSGSAKGSGGGWRRFDLGVRPPAAPPAPFLQARRTARPRAALGGNDVHLRRLVLRGDGAATSSPSATAARRLPRPWLRRRPPWAMRSRRPRQPPPARPLDVLLATTSAATRRLRVLDHGLERFLQVGMPCATLALEARAQLRHRRVVDLRRLGCDTRTHTTENREHLLRFDLELSRTS
jgi:hypothetical protein